MKKAALILLFNLCVFSLFGQDTEKYRTLVRKAFSLYQQQDYLASAQTYHEAFAVFDGGGYITDKYNAACSWSLVNQKDSAFTLLFTIAKKGNYSNLDHIQRDTDLLNLHEDDRWPELLTIVEANLAEIEKNYNFELIEILRQVHKDDQSYRQKLDEVEEEFGRESEELKALWDTIARLDSINLILVTKILDEHGWLGADILSPGGNTTLFLVIQHADIETQEKYLPMMRDAVKKGNAAASQLALLEDRVALRQGDEQIYGSQIGRDLETGEYYVLPLVDPENVNARRKEVGLGPLEGYTALYGFEWNVEKHLQRMEQLEKEE